MISRLVRLAPAALGAFLLLAPAAPAAASSYSFGHSAEFEYALVEPSSKGDRTISSGSWDRVERILDRYDGPLFYFHKDGKSWIVRDAALLGEAKRITAPMQEIGAQQGKLGSAQGKLGAAQGKLGREMGKLGAKQGKLGARLGMLATHAAFDDDADAGTRAEIRAIEDEMEELGRAQERLARQQEPLAEQQEELGAQQEKLGKLQSNASKKAHAELKRLADRAISSGKATRVED